MKIEAIVRKILEIAKSDPDGKIILFSTVIFTFPQKIFTSFMI